jgi:hypothetical protein
MSEETRKVVGSQAGPPINPESMSCPREGARVHANFRVQGICPTGTTNYTLKGLAVQKDNPSNAFQPSQIWPCSSEGWEIDFNIGSSNTGEYVVVIWGFPTTLAVSITVIGDSDTTVCGGCGMPQCPPS